MNTRSLEPVRFALAAYAFLVPFESVLDVLARQATVLKPYRLVGLGLIYLWLMRNTTKRSVLRFDPFDRCMMAVGALGVVMASFWSIVDGRVNLTWVISDVTVTLFAFLVFLIMKQVAHRPGEMDRIMTAFAAGIVVSILLSLVVLPSEASVGRFKGFMENPNSLGLAAAVAIVFLASRLLFDPHAPRITCGVGILILGVALLFTGARGVILGLILALLVLSLSFRRLRLTLRRLRVRRASAAAAVVVVVLAGISLDTGYTRYRNRSSGVNRLDRSASDAAGSRLDLVSSAWNVATKHYFLGVGFGAYRSLHRASIAEIGSVRSPNLLSNDVATHDTYLDVLTSEGAAGLVIYLAGFGRLCWAIKRRFRTDMTEGLVALAGAFPLIALIMVVGFGQGLFLSPTFWLALAYICSSASWDRGRTRRVPIAGALPTKLLGATVSR